MRGLRVLDLIGPLSAVLLTAVAVMALAGRPAAAADAAKGRDPKLTAHYAYLGKAYADPPPLSLLDPIVDDEGLAGARLGDRENQATGRLLGDAFAMEEVVVPRDGDVAAAADALFAACVRFVIADLDGPDLLAVAGRPGAADAMILNIRDGADDLRQGECRANVFHVVPSYAQRTDGLAQYLIWKRWKSWLLVAGTSTADAAYAAAVERSAVKFGAEIVERRSYAFEAGSRRVESGHQQVQTQMPMVTQGAPDYDVAFVADVSETFGEYLSYQTDRPRPVAGTHGLTGVGWHRAFEQFGGMSLQSSFERRAKRWMRERDYDGWLAAKIFGEAVTRTGSADPATVRAYVTGPEFKIAGHKGIGMTFRPWDNQLRQPILVMGPRALVSISPQEGFLHERSELDTLGFDLPDSTCHFP